MSQFSCMDSYMACITISTITLFLSINTRTSYYVIAQGQMDIIHHFCSLISTTIVVFTC